MSLVFRTLRQSKLNPYQVHHLVTSRSSELPNWVSNLKMYDPHTKEPESVSDQPITKKYFGYSNTISNAHESVEKMEKKILKLEEIIEQLKEK